VHRFLATLVHAPYLYVGRFFARMLTRRARVERGMSLWYDMHDWLGGYPFEVSTPQKIVQFCAERGFEPRQVVTCGAKPGCNEFVFHKTAERRANRPRTSAAADARAKMS
jgi:2-polyprenyl-6-hydroxyphenyl methylase/3-demethylubiquinone-9 3-methyltransferase